VTDGAPFQRQLALANPDDETSNATTLVRREPAPGSGFSLLRIAAYSYIVNPDLAYGRVALPRILAPRRRKAPPGPFSSARRFCTSKVAPNQRPAFPRRGPLTKVYRLCRRHVVDVGGSSESDPEPPFRLRLTQHAVLLSPLGFPSPVHTTLPAGRMWISL
jgi:hypothetical protein